MLNQQATWNFVDKFWDNDVMPSLSEFITIPCKTRTLDPKWQENGYLLKAANLVKDWFEKQNIPGAKVQVLTIPDRSPFVYIDIPGTDKNNKTALFYGHLDKMPETEGWDEGLGPWQPVVKNDCLYGRGAADDGYSFFLPVVALKALQQQNVPYPRCAILLESSEECGSPDFACYFEKLEKDIGKPNLIVIPDAGCCDYNRLWNIISLRGGLVGDLSVEILTKSIHSGTASGIVPSSFRIMRMLLSRLENEQTGEILIDDFYTDIPDHHVEKTTELAGVLGHRVHADIPFVEGARPISNDPVEMLLNRTWRPTLSVTGAHGLPTLHDAGNVLRPITTLRLSLRVPPKCNQETLANKVKEILEKDPPYGAKVEFKLVFNAHGWHAPEIAPWLEEAAYSASMNYYGNKPAYLGEGGTIGTVQMLGEKYPNAQIIVGGVLGPDACEHGPNERLHITPTKKFACCIAEIIATLAAQK